MTAKGSTSTMIGDWKEILFKSHIFFPVKSADAEMLPCIHVLCSSCLKSGDRMDCTVCKLDFDIPSNKILLEREATKELLAELSKAANDIKRWCEICREKYPSIWNERSGQSASVYCTLCRKYECLACVAETSCSNHRTVALKSHLTGKPTNHGNYKRHKKWLEVYCIACGKADCFLCLVNNDLYQMKNDFDKAIGLAIDLQSLDALPKLSASRAQAEGQIRQFGSSVTKLEIQIEADYAKQKKVLENHKKSLLNQLRSAATEAKQQFEHNKSITDTLSKKADTHWQSCVSIRSMGKPEEKFCAVGPVRNKTDEIRKELDSLIELRLPTISYESPDLDTYLQASKIVVHRIGKTFYSTLSLSKYNNNNS